MSKHYEPTVMTHPVKRSPLLGLPRTEWPEDMELFLREKFLAGYSSTQIAQAINGSGRWPKFPKTRNSIIGKIHRLGIGDTRPLRETETAARAKAKSQIWNPQLDAHILKQYAEGLNLGVIADNTNVAFGTAMAHQTIRYRLVDLGVYKRAGKAVAHARSTKAGYSAPPLIVNIVEALPSTSVHSHDTDRSMCQWPTSEDARDMHVCGQKVVQGAYCARHSLIAYRQPPSARRNALFHRRNEYDSE
jgi:hypothetical protein